MIIADKIYLPNISLIRSDGNMIEKGSYIDFCLDNAIKSGLSIIKDEFYELFERDAENEKEIEDFIINHTSCFSFSITVISGNRKIFNTSEELIEYFQNNIDKISNENLYDFLLSLVEYDILSLDCNGNIIGNYIESQSPLDELVCIFDVEFSEETCKNGKYRFLYNHTGKDTL